MPVIKSRSTRFTMSLAPAAGALTATLTAGTKLALRKWVLLLATGIFAAVGSPLVARTVRQAPSTPNAANDGQLTFINNPGGGHVVYGSLDNMPSMRDAMGFMLKQVHRHFGDRPQISRFFQTRSGDSVATFFTLTDKRRGQKPTAGMVIVTMPHGLQPAAAVLFDDANRFLETQPDLMARLSAAWSDRTTPASHPGSARSGRDTPDAGDARPLPVPPMHTVAVGGGTGTISLPSGWNVNGGPSEKVVKGPHGEQIFIGLIQNIYDPRNPRAAGVIRYLQMGHNPFFACPRTDAVSAFICVLNQDHARQHKPAVQFTPSRVSPIAGGVVVEGTVNANDGSEPKHMVAQITPYPEGPQGVWAMAVCQEVAPRSIASQQWPTISAIAMSYRENGAAYQRLSSQMVDQIHLQSEINTRIASERSQQQDEHNRDVERTWDDNAKYNKAFQNYQLDRSAISTTDNEYHGTFTNKTADELVRSNPDRLQYTQTQDFVRGVDY